MILVRVVTTDGLNTGTDDSDSTFIVEPFSAGGQRSDVNDFLSYSSPHKVTTSLPTETTEFTVVINYSDKIIPNSFKAILNTIDISSTFNPVAGTNEFVTIPLNDGRNTLKITVDGIRDDGRTATDRDSLVFKIG